MKANRKFIEAEDEAVSAVIGVILMVAITVAIAATVYVYVSGMIGTSPESAPEVQFVKDDINDKLTVAKAEPGNLNWGDLEITYTSGKYVWLYAGTAYNLSTNPDLSSVSVDAGDYLYYINDTCTITIRHVDTNTLLGTWEFH